MAFCPHCHHNLTFDDLQRSRCPQCQRQLDLGGDTTITQAHDQAATETIDLEATTETFEQRIESIWSHSVTEQTAPDQTIKIPVRIRTVTSTITAKPKHLIDVDHASDPTCDYAFIHKLGEGGMGVVYEAQQTSIDRQIALKMIKSTHAMNESQCHKFLAEAVVTGDLEHPNIVPVYDLGTNDEGRPFYVMKRVRGRPWKELIGELTLSENLEILLRVADAVAFAHSKGVIHRDLKPANVMVGEFGEVLVMDWGLAAAISDNSKASQVSDRSAMCGTPAYMAPEMASGVTAKIGIETDIYLLGAMLYEVITGRPPRSGRSVMDCLIKAGKNEIDKTDQGGELLDIAGKAMAFEPLDRYRQVRDFQNAIREYESHTQSNRLFNNAMDHLEQAGQTGEYDHYVRALFGFEQSGELWEGNSRSNEAIENATVNYARCAFEKGDLDLAASLLDQRKPSHQSLYRRIQSARREQLARRWRYKMYRRVVTGLTAAVVVILAVASIWISIEKSRAVYAERQARTAQMKAEQQREQADIARRQESEQRKIADAATAKAKAEEARAVDALERMKQAVADMMEARSREEIARTRAKTAELMAAGVQDQLARAGMLMDNSWWTFDAEEALVIQKRASEQYGYQPEMMVGIGPGVELELVLIPPGSFVMGSPAEETHRGGEEYLHRVVITRPFYISRYELTRRQWQMITGSLPEMDQSVDLDNDVCPMMAVNWRELVDTFLPAVNRFSPMGYTFRLPTEAEWEYACRAGTGTSYNLGNTIHSLEEAGWFLSNSGGEVRPIGTKLPNQWGLYDMHGNVAEWCIDTYDPGYYLVAEVDDPVNEAVENQARTIRGGGCINLPEHCRSAYRSWAHPLNHYRFLGLRLVLEPVDYKPVHAAVGEQ